MTEPWVELRVHGVSGGPPESMLDFDRVTQVAGDEFGRTFRRFDEHGNELREADGHIMEAYHWGRFTSGSWRQALWLLLAPFGVVNAAQFTLEPPTSGFAKACHAVAGSMLRLTGLALTLLFVAAAAVISMDLWAWQRIGPGAGFPFGLVLAAAMLAPVILLEVCFLLGRSRFVDSEERPVAPPPVPAPDGIATLWNRTPPSDLVRPGFFEGDPDAPTLGRLHVAAGLALVAMLGFAPSAGPGNVYMPWGYWTSVGLLGLVTVVVAVLGDPEQSASITWQSRWLERVKLTVHRAAASTALLLEALAVAVLAASMIHIVLVPPSPSDAIHYPGIDWVADVTMLVAVTGLIVLAAANALLAFAERTSAARSSNQRFAPYAGGLACTLLTSLGLFLGVGYAGAFCVTAATALDTADRHVRVPELLSRIGYAWGITAVMLAALIVLGLVRRHLSRETLRRRVIEDFTRADGLRIPARWTARVASAIWVARLKNSLVCLLGTLAIVGIALSVAAAIELAPLFTAAVELWPALTGRPQQLPGVLDWLSQSEAFGNTASDLLTGLGAATLTGFATVLVVLGRTAILGESARRGVNVVWDVIAFWPRSAHPFVPQAYSQRAVPDLEKRISSHLDRSAGPSTPTGRRLVLCGHSQGSLLSFATLLRLAGSRPLDDVGFLTFGSQLQVMFSRGFPAYVNHRTIEYLFERLDGAWRNLYRDTDALAGPVLSWNHDPASTAGWFGHPPPPHVVDLRDGPEGRQQYGADWRLLDPPIPPDPGLQTQALDALRGHGDYWRDDAWPDALAEVRRTRPPSPLRSIGTPRHVEQPNPAGSPDPRRPGR